MTELSREAAWTDAKGLSSSESGVPETRQPCWQKTLLAICGIVLALSLNLLIILSALPPSPLRTVFAAIIALTFLSFPLAFWLQRAEKRRASRLVAELGEFPVGVGRFVLLKISQGDATTGEDLGLLWFEDDRLYFVGRRTSFGLVPSQIYGRARTRTGFGDKWVEVGLLRETVAGPMRVMFQQILPEGLPDVESEYSLGPSGRWPHQLEFVRRAALITDLDVWASGVTEGEGQYPPTALGPDVIGERRLLIEALLLTVPPAAVLSLVASLLNPTWTGTAFLLGVFLLAGMVPAGNLRWRALRDRRRLRRAS